MSSIKNESNIYLTSLFVACGLVLLPSELFRIVGPNKLQNS